VDEGRGRQRCRLRGDERVRRNTIRSGLPAALDIQPAALTTASRDTIRSYKITDTRTEGRAELETILAFFREGDGATASQLEPHDAKREPQSYRLVPVMQEAKETGNCGYRPGWRNPGFRAVAPRY
jgi:hypothetical protein